MKKHVFLFLLLIPAVSFAQNTLYFMERIPLVHSLNPALNPGVEWSIGLPAAFIDWYSTKGFDDFEESFLRGQMLNDDYRFSEGISFAELSESYRQTYESVLNILSYGKKTKYGYYSFAISYHEIHDSEGADAYLFFFKNYKEFLPPLELLETPELYVNEIRYTKVNPNFSIKVNEFLTLGVGLNLNILNRLELQDISKFTVEYMEIPDENGELQAGYKKSHYGHIIFGGLKFVDDDAFPGSISSQYGKSYPIGHLDDVDTKANPLDALSLSANFGISFQQKGWTLAASALNIRGSKLKTGSGYLVEFDNDNMNMTNLEKVTNYIPTKYYFSASKRIADFLNLGAVHHITKYKWGTASSSTASVNSYIGKLISASFSYTSGNHLNSFGAGIRLRVAPGVDLYAATDDVLLKNKNRLTARFGINITKIGKKGS